MAEKMPSLEKNKGTESENLNTETEKETKFTPLKHEVKEYFSKHSEEIYRDYDPVQQAKEKYYYLLDSIIKSADYLKNPRKLSAERRKKIVGEGIKENAKLAREALKDWIDAEVNFGKKYRPEIKEYILREQEKASYAGKSKEEIRQEIIARDQKNLDYNRLEIKLHIYTDEPQENPEELPELDGYFFPEEK